MIALGRTCGCQGDSAQNLVYGQRRSSRRVTRVPQRKNQGHFVVKRRPSVTPASSNHQQDHLMGRPPCASSNHQQDHLVGRPPPASKQPSTGSSRGKASSLQQSSTGSSRGKASSLQQSSTGPSRGKRNPAIQFTSVGLAHARCKSI